MNIEPDKSTNIKIHASDLKILRHGNTRFASRKHERYGGERQMC